MFVYTQDLTSETVTNVPETCKFNQNNAAMASISFEFDACGATEVITHEDYIALQIKAYHAVSTNGVLTSAMNPMTLECRLR